MSVLIKGMEMPKCCAECPLNHDAECYPYNRLVCEEPYTKRGDWCPLVEIKPHGRLIDKTELEKEVCAGCDSDCYGCAIGRAPTIIEAEDGT